MIRSIPAIPTIRVRAIGIGISSAADHEILASSLSNEWGVRFEIVRPASTPRVYTSTEITRGWIDTTETSGKMPARNPADKVPWS